MLEAPLAGELRRPLGLGEREEPVGVDQASLGVIPADETLDRLERAARQVDLRLEVEDELILGDGLGNTKVEVPTLIGLSLDEALFVLKASS